MIDGDLTWLTPRHWPDPFLVIARKQRSELLGTPARDDDAKETPEARQLRQAMRLEDVEERMAALRCLVRRGVIRRISILACLSAEEETLISLRYWAGLKFGEIGLLLERPEGTVRDMHHRALPKLRGVLHEQRIYKLRDVL